MKAAIAALITALVFPLAASAARSLGAEVVDAEGRSTRLVVSSFTLQSAVDRRPRTAVIEVEDGSVFRDSLLSGEPVEVVVEGLGTPIRLRRCFVKSWSTSGDADDRPVESVTLRFAGASW